MHSRRRLPAVAPLHSILVSRHHALGNVDLSPLGLGRQSQVPYRLLVPGPLLRAVGVAQASSRGLSRHQPLADHAVHGMGNPLESDLT